jgi:hypothetical protein
MCSITRRNISYVFSEHKDIIYMIAQYELQHRKKQVAFDIWRPKINKIKEEMNTGEKKWRRKMKYGKETSF